MAVLKALPSTAIIDGFKGSVDFYLWKGLACARRWPRWHARTPTDAERASQVDLAYAARACGALSPHMKAQWRQLATGTRFTWREMFVRAYIRGLWE